MNKRSAASRVPYAVAVLATIMGAAALRSVAHEGHGHDEADEAQAVEGDHAGHQGMGGKQAAGETVTLAGEVLDLSCYLGHGSTGKKHQKCAKACLIEKHVSAGLLTADGTVYLLVQDHKHEKAFAPVGQLAAEKVKVTGVKAMKGGLQAILVHKVEKA